MRALFTAYRVVILCFVFAIGIVAGSYYISPTLADSIVGDTNTNHAVAPVYPKNSNGQTYGSSLHAPSPDEEPDLIQAYGVDGNIGYVYKKDLDGDMPKTPEEAIRKQKSAPDHRIIPLYDVDGKTVIGKFKVWKGDGKVK